MSLEILGLSLEFFGLSLEFFGLSLEVFGLSLEFFGLSLEFFGLSLEFPGLNQEFSFTKTGCLTDAKQLSLPNYLPIVGGARGVMVIVIGNGHSDMSSNPGQD